MPNNEQPASHILSTIKLQNAVEDIQDHMVLPYLTARPDAKHQDVFIGMVGYIVVAAKAAGTPKERLAVLVDQIYDLAEQDKNE